MSLITSVIIKTSTNERINVTNNLILSTVRIQDRDDLSLERGSFSFISSYRNFNIPPFSVCEIVRTVGFDDVTEYYCISSVCTRNLINNYYTHDCTLLSLNAILECFILGAKAFSISDNQTDRNVITKALNIINDKYDINIQSSVNNNILENFSNEYFFPTGSTLLDMCQEIAAKNNIRYKVILPSNYVSGNVAFGNLTLEFYFTTSTYRTYNISEYNELILNEYQHQKTDDYSLVLESEASDVIDRNTPVKFRGLTCRTFEDALLTSDNAVIKLPLKVESIEKFEVYSSAKAALDFDLSGILTPANIQSWGGMLRDSRWHMTMSYELWVEASISYGGISNIFQYFLTQIGDTLNGLLEEVFDASCDENGGNAKFEQVGASLSPNETYYNLNNNTPMYIDFSEALLETSVWKGLPLNEQTTYAAYDSGGDEIYNLNSSYRDNFWGRISGLTTGNFLEESRATRVIQISSNVKVIMKIKPNETDPLRVSYSVVAYPFTNPYFYDEKNGASYNFIDAEDYFVNESMGKKVARSYSMGDSNGFAVDFKALTNDMDQQNETLGRHEITLEIDTSTLKMSEADSVYGFYLFKAGDEVHYSRTPDWFTYYITSLERRYTPDREITQINLAMTRTKIADAIGVDYQYNPTLLPLNNVVTRPIEFHLTNTTIYDDLNTLSSIEEAMLQLNFTKGNKHTTIVSRCAIQKTSEYFILYAEAVDNIVFGYSSVDNADNTYKYKMEPVTYSFDGAADSLSIDLLIVSQLSETSSRLLPSNTNFNSTYNTFETINLISSRNIYKDPKEKLTFTIKIKR